MNFPTFFLEVLKDNFRPVMKFFWNNNTVSPSSRSKSSHIKKYTYKLKIFFFKKIESNL